jgi:hypothetical protein
MHSLTDKIAPFQPPRKGVSEATLALHGQQPPAIDQGAVLASWRRLWRSVLRDLTPLQREALERELGEGGE